MPFNFPEGSPFEEFFKRFGSPQGQPESRHATALGSGFIIDADGYVVTNNHVIDGASEVTVRLGDETTYPAEIVGRSEEHTSELQSLMRISYAVFCLKKKTTPKTTNNNNH